MARVYVYVDGFNLYKGRCEGRPGRRWLNLRALSERLMSADEIVAIRYFSAWVHGVDKAIRQNIYMRALRTIPGFQEHMGYFSTWPKWMELVTPEPDGRTQAEVWKTQEKGSDVNLATYLLLDGFDQRYEAALVISNDQDLTAPVREAARFGPIHVVAPNDRPGSDLERAAATFRRLGGSYIRQSQFPDEMADAEGTFRKPERW